ncbi:hypothetical protein V2J09_009604 [Rumex salicifolius]
MEDHNSQIQQQSNLSDPHLQSFEPPSSHDDFLEQMLSALPNFSFPDLSNPNPDSLLHLIKPLEDSGDALPGSELPLPFPSIDDLSSKLRHHVNGGVNSSSMAAASKSFLLQQQQLLLSRAHLGADSGLVSFPLSLAGGDSVESRIHDMVSDVPSFKSTPQQGADASVQALYNGFPSQQPFQAGAMSATNQTPVSGSAGGSGQAPQRQRIRARRGQATDPHSIAERLRRERIAERMKALQELVPNANKTDKASMLDEIIDYVKFLQLQVKVLSMSRLGGAAANPSSEGGGRSSNNGNPGVVGSSNEGMSVTEHQVVKLMEEDMGSAMQYLQGKGLCLMPISLATAISTTTCHPRTASANRQPPPPPPRPNNPMAHLTANANSNGHGGQAPSSPNLSGLTVQSTSLVNGDGFVKDSNPAPHA